MGQFRVIKGQRAYVSLISLGNQPKHPVYFILLGFMLSVFSQKLEFRVVVKVKFKNAFLFWDCSRIETTCSYFGVFQGSRCAKQRISVPDKELNCFSYSIGVL